MSIEIPENLDEGVVVTLNCSRQKIVTQYWRVLGHITCSAGRNSAGNYLFTAYVDDQQPSVYECEHQALEHILGLHSIKIDLPDRLVMGTERLKEDS